MKKQLVLFVCSVDEYDSIKSMNNDKNLVYFGHGNRAELLLGHNNTTILITKFGRESMTHEFESVLLRVKNSNTIIYL